MSKSDTIPTLLKGGDPDAAHFRVVDAKSGNAIDHVLEADSEKGTLTRLVVENGNLVREGDAFATVKEERAIRFRPVAEPKAEDMVGSTDEGEKR